MGCTSVLYIRTCILPRLTEGVTKKVDVVRLNESLAKGNHKGQTLHFSFNQFCYVNLRIVELVIQSLLVSYSFIRAVPRA